MPVLLWKIRPQDELSLNRYEGYPNFYRKEMFEVELNGRPRINFFSCDWWKSLWEKSKLVHVERCSSVQCHTEAWDDWLACDNPYAKKDIGMIAAENGKYFDTIQL